MMATKKEPRPTTFVRQGDPRWAKIKLGLQPSSQTIHSAGCLLCCYTQFLVDVGRPNITPDRVQNEALVAHTDKHPCFLGANIIQKNFGAALGIKVGEVVRAPEVPAKLYATLVDALKVKDGRAVIGVTHDADGYTDHFILARAIDGNFVLCSDPATGEEVRLDMATFEGPANGGKVYKILSVRPISTK